jgi:glycosyltransferase involved in cell wall biosynthesis
MLALAIDSVRKQTLQDFEIIVVVDGEAGTESADLVRGISDARVRCIVNATPAGGSEARNIGMREARADWIALLDDDDEWLPEKLEKQKRAADTSPDAAVTVFTCLYIYRTRGAPDMVRPRRLPAPGEAATDFMFDYLCYFQTSTFFCSKELMMRVPFTKDMALFQDIDWFLRVMRDPRARLVVLPEVLSIYLSPEGRQSIISGSRWEARIEWGRDHRALMSRRAYSRFVVGSCAGRAAQQRSGLRGLAVLLYECVWHGAATPKLVLLLCATFCISPDLRVKLRDRFLLRRRSQPEIDLPQ